MDRDQRQVTIIGAGLAGSLLSMYLTRYGFQVDILERRPDMRTTTMSAGRSINLALSTRGIHALRQVGVLDQIMEIAIAMKGRMMHSPHGELSFQPYGKNESEVIYATSRAYLNMTLMSAAEQSGVARIQFNKRCTGMDFSTGSISILDETTGRTETVPSTTVIASDGSSSAIRLEMQQTRRFNFSQQYLDYGYKELVIPPGPGGSHLLDKNSLHIWPRGTFMLIALPNIDGSFTCTFFYPLEGEQSFQSLKSPEQVSAFFEREFPDAVPLMPTLLEDFFGNPTGTMVTVKCDPWFVDDRVLLLGDAAHAIVPFFGQGMNCAFEDCTVLDEILMNKGSKVEWAEVFREFASRRKENADAIADLAVENFVEMRDLVAQPSFLLRKKVEQQLELRYPGVFVPKYSMVTFHRIPYAVARERGQAQDEILDELCRNITLIGELDWGRADVLINPIAPL